MPVTYVRGEKAGQTEFTGQVYAVELESFQVMSDMYETHQVARIFADGCRGTVTLSGGWNGTQATAEVDATPPVFAEMAEYDETTRMIRETESAFDHARRKVGGRKCRVVKGRKVPLGDGYTITSPTPSKQSFSGHTTWTVTLRDSRNEYRYVNEDNIEVDQNELGEGPAVLACPGCRTRDAFEIEQHTTGPACRDCRENDARKGWINFRLPGTLNKYAQAISYNPAHNSYHEISRDESAFFLHAFNTPDDAAPWLIFADWLDETGTEENAHRASLIRECLQPKAKKTRSPRAKKEVVCNV